MGAAEDGTPTRRESVVRKGNGDRRGLVRKGGGLGGGAKAMIAQRKWQSSAGTVQNVTKQTGSESSKASALIKKLRAGPETKEPKGSREKKQNWQAAASAIKHLLKASKRAPKDPKSKEPKEQADDEGDAKQYNAELNKAAIVIQRLWRQKRLKVITARIIARKRALDEKLKRQQERMARQKKKRQQVEENKASKRGAGPSAGRRGSIVPV